MKHNSITEQTHFLGVLLPEHITIMNELELKEDFPVDNIAVFERTAGVWKTGEILYFSK